MSVNDCFYYKGAVKYEQDAEGCSTGKKAAAVDFLTSVFLVKGGNGDGGTEGRIKKGSEKGAGR